MGVWINIVVMWFILFILAEELLYYFWNRYVYGPKKRKPRYWKSRIVLGITIVVRMQRRKTHRKYPVRPLLHRKKTA